MPVGSWNGQGGGYDATCSTGSVRWRAASGPAPTTYEVAETPGVTQAVADGRTIVGIGLPNLDVSEKHLYVVQLDGRTGATLHQATIEAGPQDLASVAIAAGKPWVGTEQNGCAVHRVDPATGAYETSTGLCPLSLHGDGDQLWAVDFLTPDGRGNALVRIDGTTGQVTAFRWDQAVRYPLAP